MTIVLVIIISIFSLRDLQKYIETIGAFKVQAISERYELLRQLGNIYVVRPEHLRQMLDEGLLARLDAAVLHSFIVCRADYKQAKLESLFKGMMNAEELNLAAQHQSNALNVWERGLEAAQMTAAAAFEDVGDTLKRFIQ